MDKRLLFLALGMFALGADSFAVAGVLPEVARSFTSIEAAGQMTTVYAVTTGILAPVIQVRDNRRYQMVLNVAPRRRMPIAMTLTSHQRVDISR